jgi:hypothetical protein
LLNTIFGSLSSGVAASTNSYESISTVTVGSGGTSEINFTSIPSTYTHLQIRLIGRVTSSVTELRVKFNGDTNTANYFWHELYGTGTAAGAISQTGGGTPLRTMYWGGLPIAANIFGAGVMDILDYANTNKNKVLRMLSGYDTNGAGYLHFDSGLWISLSAITSITLYPPSVNLTEYSSFALYGIKGS